MNNSEFAKKGHVTKSNKCLALENSNNDDK